MTKTKKKYASDAIHATNRVRNLRSRLKQKGTSIISCDRTSEPDPFNKSEGELTWQDLNAIENSLTISKQISGHYERNKEMFEFVFKKIMAGKTDYEISVDCARKFKATPETTRTTISVAKYIMLNGYKDQANAYAVKTNTLMTYLRDKTIGVIETTQDEGNKLAALSILEKIVRTETNLREGKRIELIVNDPKDHRNDKKRMWDIFHRYYDAEQKVIDVVVEDVNEDDDDENEDT